MVPHDPWSLDLPYPDLVAMSKCTSCWHTDCTCDTRTSQCDHQRSVCLKYSRYQPSQIFRTTKPNDCQNLTFDAVSFFLLNNEMFLIDVVSPPKNMSLVCFACSFRTSISRYRCRITLSLSSPYMQSNGNLFSAKIEQSAVLIHNAKRQICNAPYDDQKANDLRRSFRHLISTLGENSCIATLIVAACTRDYVVFNANNVYVDIYRYILFMLLSWF